MSVIIPAHNAERTIARAIDSVLSQDWSNLELLIVNNGSSDSTEAIVKQYQERDIRVELIQSRLGRSVARNMGIALATGDYLQFLDADDELGPQKLTRAVSFLEHHRDYQAYICSAVYRNDVTGDSSEVPISLRFADEFLGVNLFPINSVLFRNEAVERFETDLEYNEDWLFWAQNLAGKKLKIASSEYDALVHITGSNTMNQYATMLGYQLYVRAKIADKFKAVGRRFLLKDLRLCAGISVGVGILTREQAQFIQRSRLGCVMALARVLIHFPPFKKMIQKKAALSRSNSLYEVQ